MPPLEVEVRTQYLVPVTFDAAKHRNTVVGLHVPQAKVVVLGHGQQQIWVN